MNATCFIAALSLAVFLVTPVAAQESSAKNDYEAKISELESRVQELEKARAKEESTSELDALLQEAQMLKGEKKEVSINRVFKGSERFQPQLNPEVSMTGDFFGSTTSLDKSFNTEPGTFSDGRNQFYLREAELNVVAPLDPFTRGKFFLGIPGTGESSFI